MRGVWVCVWALGAAAGAAAQPSDDLIFIHHSTGQNWLSSGLHAALEAKPYLDERNDATYGTDLAPDAGRPDALGPVPGDLTDMQHWLHWFNDYGARLRAHGCATGYNRVVMFKSCFPNSQVTEDGAEPGDPFSPVHSLANHRAVFRHPSGPGHPYAPGGYAYLALEDVFAAHPECLFVAVTPPPLHFAPYDATTDANAARARAFASWLRAVWQPAYAARTGLHNAAVFDLFDLLAYPADDAAHPNRLRAEYGGNSGNSHPNAAANAALTAAFATGPANFLDAAWALYLSETPAGDADGDGLPDAWESAHGLDPERATGDDGASGDPDRDTLTNAEEWALGSHPRNADSDGDTLPDGWERQYALDPASGAGDDGAQGDPDGDGADNAREYAYGTNPRNALDAPVLPLAWWWPAAALGMAAALHARHVPRRAARRG